MSTAAPAASSCISWDFMLYTPACDVTSSFILSQVIYIPLRDTGRVFGKKKQAVVIIIMSALSSHHGATYTHTHTSFLSIQLRRQLISSPASSSSQLSINHPSFRLIRNTCQSTSVPRVISSPPLCHTFSKPKGPISLVSHLCDFNRPTRIIGKTLAFIPFPQNVLIVKLPSRC